MAVTGSETTRTGLRRPVRVVLSPERIAPARRRPSRRRRPPHRTFGERLLVLAERTVGLWAPTIRQALLLALAMVFGLVLVLVFAGWFSAVLCAAAMVLIATTRHRWG